MYKRTLLICETELVRRWGKRSVRDTPYIKRFGFEQFLWKEYKNPVKNTSLRDIREHWCLVFPEVFVFSFPILLRFSFENWCNSIRPQAGIPFQTLLHLPPPPSSVVGGVDYACGRPPADEKTRAHFHLLQLQLASPRVEQEQQGGEQHHHCTASTTAPTSAQLQPGGEGE